MVLTITLVVMRAKQREKAMKNHAAFYMKNGSVALSIVKKEKKRVKIGRNLPMRFAASTESDEAFMISLEQNQKNIMVLEK